jgi:hypothetical protein
MHHGINILPQASLAPFEIKPQKGVFASEGAFERACRQIQIRLSRPLANEQSVNESRQRGLQYYEIRECERNRRSILTDQ